MALCSFRESAHNLKEKAVAYLDFDDEDITRSRKKDHAVLTQAVAMTRESPRWAAEIVTLS
jgi:hypothetical protein